LGTTGSVESQGRVSVTVSVRAVADAAAQGQVVTLARVIEAVPVQPPATLRYRFGDPAGEEVERGTGGIVLGLVLRPHIHDGATQLRRERDRRRARGSDELLHGVHTD